MRHYPVEVTVLFGYIKPFKPDLRFCEYDIYKAAYCTLCKRLGKNYGIPARMLLNYDFAFLSLICLSIGDKQPCFEKSHCCCNAAKKCIYCKGFDEKFDMLSAVVVISVYHNLTDDIEDSGFWKSLPKRTCRGLIKGAYKKAKRLYPVFDEITSDLMLQQSALEKESCSSVDEAAQPSAVFLSRLASAVCSEEFSQLGYHLGRWIYLIDCADDLKKDIKSGEYNPLKCRFSINSGNADGIFDAYEYVKAALEHTQVQLCYEYDNLHFERYEQIIGNIIFEGLPSVRNRVFNEIEAENKRNGESE